MYICREIPTSGHYLVTGNPDGSDWLMQPFADYGFNAFQFGCAGAEHVWFVNADNAQSGRTKVRLYHVPSRRLVATLAFEHGYASVIASRDGRLVYVFSKSKFEKDKSASVVLSVVDVSTGAITKVHEHLPGRSWREAYCELPDGKLMMGSSTFTDGVRKRGVVLIDPISGQWEGQYVEDHSRSSEFKFPSPDGRYWLREDGTFLPVLDVKAPGVVAKLIGKSKRYYGLSVQLWETSPLRFLRRIVVAWLPMEHLPNEGHKDLYEKLGADPLFQVREQFSSNAATAAMAANLPPSTGIDPSIIRKKFWDAIATATSNTQIGPLDALPQASFGDEIVTSKEYLELINDNWDVLLDRWIDAIAWQPDGTAFWVQTRGHVACTGLDGMLSSGLYPERTGLNPQAAWLCELPYPPQAIAALPDRRLRATYDVGIISTENGIVSMQEIRGAVVMNGAPNSAPHYVKAIPKDSDGWVAYVGPTDTELLGRISAIKSQQAGIKCPVRSWSEKGCMDAIDALTAKIKRGFQKKAQDNVIRATFNVGQEAIEEDVFFEKVRAEFPGASPAIRRLIDRLCDVMPPGAELFWDGDEAIGIFGHAVKALALMDREALPTVGRYVLTLDTEHELFFGQTTLPAIIDAHDWAEDMVLFVGSVFLRDLVNSAIDTHDIWTNQGLREAVVGRYDAGKFARRVAYEIGSNKIFHSDQCRFGNTVMDQFHDGFETLEPWLQDFFGKLEPRMRAIERRADATAAKRKRVKPKA